MTNSPFKRYDVRGRVGDSLTEELSRNIGQAFSAVLEPKMTVVGRDSRLSGPQISAALIEGLRLGGTDVIDIGVCGSEEVYHATGDLDADGGIMVTASHNPKDENGMKLVGRRARPLSDEEFSTIRKIAHGGEHAAARSEGHYEYASHRTAYVDKVLGFIDPEALNNLNIVANAGNGAAGPTFDAILAELEARGANLTVRRLQWEPDGSFPNGVPNPLLVENRAITADAVVSAQANIGVAWDGDFDRCFFFDETGSFIDGEYVVALLAEAALATEPGGTIVHDPRLIWATEDAIKQSGGKSIVSPVGHAFVKSAMRKSKAVYGGEMSAHHYFRDFYFCDTGMITCLKMLELVSRSGKRFSELVANLKAKFPSSGEINFRVANTTDAIAALERDYGAMAKSEERIDGLSLDFGDWRMNLRASNTEPLLRLNIETRANQALLQDKVDELSEFLMAFGAE